LKHLTGLCNLPAADIIALLDMAAGFKKELLNGSPSFEPTLRNKRIALVFFENSTRTRFSFEIAARHLGAGTLNFSASASSVTKGETLGDTIKNLEAMQVDAFVLRHPSSGAADLITGITSRSVINAGDGAHEHPTQALLDLLTLRDYFGTIEGLKVIIVGDVLHSRVARSNIYGLCTAGAEVGICCPTTLMPPDADRLGVTLFTNLDEAIRWADTAIVLRLQLERAAGKYLSSLEEYAVNYGLTDERLERMQKHLLVLHPGPINREIEISNHVADRIQPPGYSKSVLLEQVTNGVAIRMAVLNTLLGS
jgi:aspartate carbamoyltransferase catalytic subunit